MSRTAKIARALTIGYGFQITVAIAGLMLTPFMLSRLGSVDYGRWLVAGQVLALMSLLDLGVTAVLPREVARAVGAVEPVGEVVRRARWLVWFQTPVVALAAIAVWMGVAFVRPELGEPLAIVLVGFVVQFPLRLYGAVLAGLQDLAFGSAIAAGAWAVTTVVSVGLVMAGYGLVALSVGWTAGQVAAVLATWMRVRMRFPAAQGVSGWPGRASLVRLIGPSLWTSIRQVSQLLLNGVELIVLGWVAGPTVVVAYVCTTKIVSLVNNQPYLLAISSLPAVAELHAAGNRERVWRACRALGLGMGMVSGLLMLAVLALNAAFVPLWVGPAQYVGPTVTFLAVVAMFVRHMACASGVVLAALRFDALMAVMGLLDGLVFVLSAALWVYLLGPVGVPLGSLTAACLVNGPVTLYVLRTGFGLAPVEVFRWLAPLIVRLAAVLIPFVAFGYSSMASDPAAAGVVAAVGFIVYAFALYPLLGRDPLRDYTRGFRVSVRRQLGFAPPASDALRAEAAPQGASAGESPAEPYAVQRTEPSGGSSIPPA
ncbi:hypothetical protein GobsT_20500 [Gemmata obscuriglobus]|uniref:Polysaccharide biosynthesis protein C-terminal domain-containing protein n=1 Tax=Gemmata obscuriglobus TaxID=114 RepID=A0A2Z3H9C2_9BACT|nr:hypothetical protein [Gemmata obscuriglobus]AWM39605.1 hypothetical protein C1280_23140 [Gemmata obscuriglobus]QEG27296.1 hypothetical protein GobsT_20500 [Gemmata obscuriglobus]VTS04107.1 Uncharacterized protein OS=Cystobacter violaceus Cb vi76 GN=Q664_33890 PE=4 SV=1 [Gemmata obscuriglobus UQM 2246]